MCVRARARAHVLNETVLLGHGAVSPEGAVGSVDPCILNLAQSLMHRRCSIIVSIEFVITQLDLCSL